MRFTIKSIATTFGVALVGLSLIAASYKSELKNFEPGEYTLVEFDNAAMCGPTAIKLMPQSRKLILSTYHQFALTNSKTTLADEPTEGCKEITENTMSRKPTQTELTLDIKQVCGKANHTTLITRKTVVVEPGKIKLIVTIPMDQGQGDFSCLWERN